MKVLIPHTRELCYYSGSFFLKKIAETLEKEKVSVSFLELSDDEADFDILEKAAHQGYDCVLDINSKLPYLVTDSGELFADTLKVPFINYILDHPLYHAPALSVPLNNYHTIMIDRYHERFTKENFKHIRSVNYLPMPGTEAARKIPFEEREYALCFSGTYEMEESIMYDIRDKGQLTYNISCDMIALMDDKNLRAEEAAKAVFLDRFGSVEEGVNRLGFEQFYMALNHLCRADKYVRFKRRHETIEKLGQEGVPMLVFGSGWEMMDIERFRNIKHITHVSIPFSFELISNSRMVLDINPLFAAGFHDRVASAMLNECVCISDMGTEAEPELTDNINYVGFTTQKLDELVEKVFRLMNDVSLSKNIAANGKKLCSEKHNWDALGEELNSIMTGVVTC